MTYYQIQARLSGGRTKTIINKDEITTLTEFVLPFRSNGTIRSRWGDKQNTYQALELNIYKTQQPWDKKSGRSFEKFVKNKRNVFPSFQRRADRVLKSSTTPVFVIMPIQGDKFGTQNNQRIFKEFDVRFRKIERLLQRYKCTAIRIDKEYSLDELVRKIKQEIEKAKFVVADLTDERPSCYFEAGYAEAKGRLIIYIASKESVVSPGRSTQIHFDIHKNVNYFTNHQEMTQKVKSTIEKNKEKLFAQEEELAITKA